MKFQEILHKYSAPAMPEMTLGDFLPVSGAEQKQFERMPDTVSYWQDAWRRLKKK